MLETDDVNEPVLRLYITLLVQSLDFVESDLSFLVASHYVDEVLALHPLYIQAEDGVALQVVRYKTFNFFFLLVKYSD